MARLNSKKPAIKTHEGGTASHIQATEMFRRSVLSCMLWEGEFYEDGVTIADRIEELALAVRPDLVAKTAIEARENMNLRHVPLLLAVALARRGKLKAGLLERIIQRPDELTEFLAIYWKDGRCPLAAQVKKGLAAAFCTFNRFRLAKYNNTDKAITLRDVMFLSHPKPEDEAQKQLFKDLVDGNLKPPDTWETNMSVSKDGKRKTDEDKAAHWIRLINEKKLGGLATLRNLRNMNQVHVPVELVHKAIRQANYDRVLPFRFISAAKHASMYANEINEAMLVEAAKRPKLQGKTILVVDVSGSMYGSSISKYSEMDRAHAASALAVFVRELCEYPVIYATAGNDCLRKHKTALVGNYRGLPLMDEVYRLCSPLGGGGIFLKQVMDYIDKQPEAADADRVIVITDEQDCDNDTSGSPNKAKLLGGHNYIINVASSDRGIAYSKFTHVNGFSEAVLSWIIELEALQGAQ